MRTIILLAGLILGNAACQSADEQRAAFETMPIWNQASILLKNALTPEEVKERFTSIMAKHGVVASDSNVRDMTGALLRFRDDEKADPVRVLECMDSGVRSPTGEQWQDTMSFCVLELTSK